MLHVQSIEFGALGGFLWVSVLFTGASLLHREELDSEQGHADRSCNSNELLSLIHLILTENEQSDADPRNHHKRLISGDHLELIVQFDRLVEELELGVSSESSQSA